MLGPDRLKIVADLATGNRPIQVLSTEIELVPDQVLSCLQILRMTGVVFERNSESGEPVYAIGSAALERMSHRQSARQRARKKNEPDLRKIGPNFNRVKPRSSAASPSRTIECGSIPGANKVENVKALLHDARQYLESDWASTETELSGRFSTMTDNLTSIRR